jgi:hypothetical protein
MSSINGENMPLGFFAVYLLDRFCQHTIIGLFKRFEFGVQLNGASILFRVTAQDALECWLTEFCWMGIREWNAREEAAVRRESA